MGRALDVGGRGVWLEEAGEGRPLVYLHGIADVHGAVPEMLPFHHALAAGRAVAAPAHPGCAASDEDETLESMDDLVFHTLEVLDALGLERVDLAGACIGGWLAAELAVRVPERIGRLVLIGASGLFVAGAPVADLFMAVQPRDGADLSDLRATLFGDADCDVAQTLYPDGRADKQTEMLRYKAMRFAARVGFAPPYFYHPKLRRRLHRYRGPALVIHGADDRMVPPAIAEAYAEGLAGARLELIAGCGHSPHLERPDETAAVVARFLDGG